MFAPADVPDALPEVMPFVQVRAFFFVKTLKHVLLLIIFLLVNLLALFLCTDVYCKLNHNIAWPIVARGRQEYGKNGYSTVREPNVFFFVYMFFFSRGIIVVHNNGDLYAWIERVKVGVV